MVQRDRSRRSARRPRSQAGHRQGQRDASCARAGLRPRCCEGAVRTFACGCQLRRGARCRARGVFAARCRRGARLEGGSTFACFRLAFRELCEAGRRLGRAAHSPAAPEASSGFIRYTSAAGAWCRCGTACERVVRGTFRPRRAIWRLSRCRRSSCRGCASGSLMPPPHRHRRRRPPQQVRAARGDARARLLPCCKPRGLLGRALDALAETRTYFRVDFQFGETNLPLQPIGNAIGPRPKP